MTRIVRFDTDIISVVFYRKSAELFDGTQWLFDAVLWGVMDKDVILMECDGILMERHWILMEEDGLLMQHYDFLTDCDAILTEHDGFLM